jgi:hypothetical protein
MIGFGFTIDTVLRALQLQSRPPVLLPRAPRYLGLALIAAGTFSLAIACVPYGISVGRLRSDRPYNPRDLTLSTAGLVARPDS